MHHYIYITVDTLSDKFYVGRHSTKNLLDGYHGSGKWVRSIKDKTRLNTHIISYIDDFETLLLAEEFAIKAALTLPNCMNFNNSSCGFGHGNFNPAKNPETLEKRSRNHWTKTESGRKFLSENNPSKRDDVKKLRSEQLSNQWKDKEYRDLHSGENHWVNGESDSAKDFRNRLMSSENPFHRQDVKDATRKRTQEMLEKGIHPFQSDEVRQRAIEALRNSEKMKLRWKDPVKLAKLKGPKKKTPCPHCGLEVAPNIMSRYHGDNCKQRI